MNLSSAIPLLSLRAFVACKKGETYLRRNLTFSFSTAIAGSQNADCPIKLTIKKCAFVDGKKFYLFSNILFLSGPKHYRCPYLMLDNAPAHVMSLLCC
jgi:hypothetical protein